MENQIKSIWKGFMKGQPIPSAVIRSEIFQSWRRCRQLGINPNLTGAPVIYAGQAFSKHKKQYENVLTISRPIMENLFNLVIGGGFIVCLADDQGVLLDVLGDPEALKIAQGASFVPGASWAEKTVGTNAVALPLCLDRPIQISRAEHYGLTLHQWAGSGAPIHGPSGSIAGLSASPDPMRKFMHIHWG